MKTKIICALRCHVAKLFAPLDKCNASLRTVRSSPSKCISIAFNCSGCNLCQALAVQCSVAHLSKVLLLRVACRSKHRHSYVSRTP